jgi:outer membrane lipoprotein-sorting protein
MVSFAQAFAAAVNPQEIMVKNRDVAKLQDMTSDATLVTGSKSKSFHWWRKLNADGMHFNTLIRFDAPVEVRGEGVLFLEYGVDDNDVLIYLPTYKKVRRVETQQQSASFMSSEFSYSDLSNPNLADFTYKFVRTEPCAGAVTCHVIDATPANDKVKDRTGYSHKTLWIRTDCFVTEKAEFFNTGGKLAKKMQVADVQKFPGTEKWMARTINFTNAQTGQVSTIKFTNVKINSHLDDSIFTEQNLSRVK